jgi:hypothetical protein
MIRPCTRKAQSRSERFPSHIVEIHIDAVRGGQVQLFEYWTGFVIEGAIEPAFVAQELDLFDRAGGPDDTASAKFCELSGNIADRARRA